jgi:hypothetical protein
MFERILSTGRPGLLVIAFMATMAFIVIWPASRICRRIGFSPVLGVLAVLPLANLLLLWYVALAEWPRVETGPRSV